MLKQYSFHATEIFVIVNNFPISIYIVVPENNFRCYLQSCWQGCSMLHPYINNVKHIALCDCVIDIRTYEIIFKNQYIIVSREFRFTNNFSRVHFPVYYRRLCQNILTRRAANSEHF